MVLARFLVVPSDRETSAMLGPLGPPMASYLTAKQDEMVSCDHWQISADHAAHDNACHSNHCDPLGPQRKHVQFTPNESKLTPQNPRDAARRSFRPCGKVVHGRLL